VVVGDVVVGAGDVVVGAGEVVVTAGDVVVGIEVVVVGALDVVVKGGLVVVVVVVAAPPLQATATNITTITKAIRDHQTLFIFSSVLKSSGKPLKGSSTL
jgi:hypothetical protein